MEPPSLRELELETLLREREAQIVELNDEVNQLRRYLSSQPAPSRTDLVTLPPALLMLLQPHINNATAAAAGQTSNTMAAALIQRTRVLQDENDELYELLRVGETGKLKEEVHCLKRVVSRLERALKDSHGTISSLTDELEKSYAVFLSHQKASNTYNRDSRSPHNTSRAAHVESQNIVNGDIKPIPTAPRAHKKPRLSDSQPSPARSSIALPIPNNTHGASGRVSRQDESGDGYKSPLGDIHMDMDEGSTRGHQDSRGGCRRDRDFEYDDSIRRHRCNEEDRGRDYHHGDRIKRKGRYESRGPKGSIGGSVGAPKGARNTNNRDIGTLRQRMGL